MMNSALLLKSIELMIYMNVEKNSANKLNYKITEKIILFSLLPNSSPEPSIIQLVNANNCYLKLIPVLRTFAIWTNVLPEKVLLRMLRIIH